MTPQELNISIPHTLSDIDRHMYIIQIRHDDGVWRDYQWGSGTNPEKKARYIRNKTGHDTRVINIMEHAAYTYEYSVGKTFEAQNETANKETKSVL